MPITVAIRTHLRDRGNRVHRMLSMATPQWNARHRGSGTRSLMIVLALLGNLATIAASAQFSLVCTKGMVLAGPACPLCHGASEQGPNPCCKWVIKDGQPIAAPELSRLVSRASDHKSFVGYMAGSRFSVAVLPDGSDPARFGLNRASPRALSTSTPTILRL